MKLSDSDRHANKSWPTSRQELLLRAALLKGEDSIAAWDEWKDSVDIDKIDIGSQRLFPILYHNLKSHDIDHPFIKIFKGIHRRTWYKNQLLFNNLSITLKSFHESGIKTIILKGAALTTLYYKDLGLRPMSDFDVLVPYDQIHEAIQILKELKWNCDHIPPERQMRKYMSVWNALTFNNDQGHQLDVHWNSFHPGSANDDDFRSRSIPVKLVGIPTAALNPSDQLLHVCVHGAWWNAVPPLRWVADSMAILNSEAMIDWNRLVEQSVKYNYVLPMRESLGYLKKKLDAPIPESVMETLRRIPVSLEHRMEYKVGTCPHDLRGPVLTFWLYYSWYSRSVPGYSHVRRLIGFPGFLRDVRMTENPLQIGIKCFSKLGETLTNLAKAITYKTNP